MVGTFFAGYLFDIMGRRLTLFLAFFTSSCFLLTVPYTSPSVYPWLLIVRILFTICISAPSSNPLLADYVHREAIGKAAAFIGLGFVIGEVLSMGVLFNITKHFTPEYAFLTAAATGTVFSVGFIFLVKEPQLRHSAKEEASESPKSLDAIVEKKTIFDSPANTPVQNKAPIMDIS